VKKCITEHLRRAKRIGFLGFGKTNRALLEYLSPRYSFEAVVRDERSSVNMPSRSIPLLGDSCYLPFGEDVLFVSPSVRRERKAVRALLSSVGLVTSDTELFFENEPSGVIAITGSDGKSTTSALVGHILNSSGTNATVCGNFGLPLTPLLGKGGYFVTELSSFMLRYLEPRSTRAAITNITPNHLDWHENINEYEHSKLSILKNATERVINFDSAPVRDAARSHEFAVFSTDLPLNILQNEILADHYFTYEENIALRDGEPIISRSELPLSGIHNVKNMLLALGLVEGLVDRDRAKAALMSFKGLRHRCELVGEINGIKFYDSSIDSTPDRTRATLSSFSKTVTVILGGRDKNVPYEPLGEVLKHKARAVILLGENSERLKAFIKQKAPDVRVVCVDCMEAAVQVASELGADVVLSLASTSFDRYKSFEERGDDFAAAVRSLK